MDLSPTWSTAPTSLERKRLHITPFNADLLERYVPPAVRSLASGISFHAVQTAPDRGFGYVELPTMEADKLKKKFNGSTLKGAKVKIEEARPEKKRKAEAEEDEVVRKARKKAKKEKRKKEEGVIPGRELEEGRHIKRGWSDESTDKKGAKKVKRSKSSKEDVAEGKSMRFKTTIPPNAMPVDKKSKSKSKDGKESKDKKPRDGREKRKVVVQEFATTQKPMISVSGASTGKGGLRYEDGKGWVDEAGNVVEAERPSKRPRRRELVDAPEDSGLRAPSDEVEDAATSKSPAENDDGSVEDDGSSHDIVLQNTLGDPDLESDGEEADIQPVEPLVEHAAAPAESSSDDAESEAEDNAEDEREGITEDGPDDPAAIEQPKEIHPLEALFKRPAPKPESATKPKPSPIDTSFNFFNSDAAFEEDGEDKGHAVYPPQTPHTKQDLEWRSLRSAAPTPDTAAIGRKFSFPFARGKHDEDEEDEDEDEDEDEGHDESRLGAVQEVRDEEIELPDANQVPLTGSKEEGQKEESEFRKWFYENRGALNRGWKKRRREERKAKRQRENRRLSRRVV